MSKEKKKKPVTSYFIRVALVLLVTLLVIYSTSYFVQEHFTGENTQDYSPDSFAALTAEPPVENIEENHTGLTEPEQQEAVDEDTVFSINDTNPELTILLDYFSARYNCVAVSLVVFDGESRDYYTYQYGSRNLIRMQQPAASANENEIKEIITRLPVDSETKFCIASLSKLITVICAMTLVDEGKLDLDKDISEYLGYEVRNPGFPDTAITARMLMQHTSSLYDPDGYWYIEGRYLPETTEVLLNSRDVWSRDLEPGTVFAYSSYFSYSVLGLVCETVSGRRFDTLAHDVLFDPLGIDAAFFPSNLSDTSNIAALFEPNHVQNVAVQDQLIRTNSETRESDHDLAAAHLTISALDYAKILAMLGNNGALGDVHILSEQSVQEIHNANFTIEGYFKTGLSSRYQHLEYFPFEGSYWHIGGAWGVHSQYIRYVDETKNRGVVVITTGASTGYRWNNMNDVCTDLSFVAMQLLRD